MKKIISFAIAAATLAFAFTSCNKYEASEPLELSSLRTVTIKGDLYAQLDKTNSTLEIAPKDLKVTVAIPLSEYNPGSSGNHFVTTTTDGNGKFSVSIPVVSTGVDAKISFESFTATVIEEAGLTGNSEKTSHFELSDQSVGGLGNGNSTKLLDLGILEYMATSTDPNSGSFVPTTSVTYAGMLTYPVKRKAGVLQADTTLTTAIPEGTIILVKIISMDEFGEREFHETKTVTTTANGMYQFDVPLVQNGTASIEITGTEILEFENIIVDERYLYVYELNASDNLYFVNYTNKDYEYNQEAFIQEVE